MQNSQHILLIRPANFGYNAQTAVSNAFQNKLEEPQDDLAKKVQQEFLAFEETLTENGVQVLVIDDTETPIKPDAVFPNNWVSFHADGTVILYPMQAANRQQERRKDIIDRIAQKFKISRVVDLSHYEKNNLYLEGTGSVIFDHVNKIAYACISPRTNPQIFLELCGLLQYQPVSFYALDQQGKEIYHTNVMMCVGEKFATICLDSISNPEEKKRVTDSLINTGHEIIDISYEQLKNFAGNMLELKSNSGKNIIALSQSAYQSLSAHQQKQLNKYSTLVPLPIPTIETIGGGSARCMIAEIFLPLAN